MKKNRITQFGILIVVVLAAIKFVFLPLSDWESASLAENRILARNIAKAKALWKNRKTLDADLLGVDKRLDKARALFPLVKTEDTKKFQLKQQQVIEKIAKGTGVKITALSWLPITSSFLHRIPVKIMVQGRPKGFYEIIRQLEKRPELIDISSFSLRRSGRRGYATGDIEVFFYALDPDMVKGE